MSRSLLLALLAPLAATCTRFTAEDCARIGIGMRLDKMKAIRGNPDRCSEVRGVSSCMWGDGTRNVKVDFIGDKNMLCTAKNLR